MQAVLDSNVIPALVGMLEQEDADIRKEIAWAISNATSGGDYFQIKQLVESGCIAPLVNLLNDSHPRVVQAVLEGLQNILKCGSKCASNQGPEAEGTTNPFVAVVKMCACVERIQGLARHNNHSISNLAVDILDNYLRASDVISN